MYKAFRSHRTPDIDVQAAVARDVAVTFLSFLVAKSFFPSGGLDPCPGRRRAPAIDGKVASARDLVVRFISFLISKSVFPSGG